MKLYLLSLMMKHSKKERSPLQLSV